MAIRGIDGAVRGLPGRVLGGPQCSDGQLLERYVARRDSAAFEALLRRHGPMVLGVCRRVLRNGHDAEDAFQATFLVLVRRAASVRPREQVGNWLYGVAYRTALKAKVTAARRAARERMVPGKVQTSDEPAADWLPLLDQEVSRLPDKYRVPVVLCDLEGKTGREAARLLGWPEGTLSTRLREGRALLGKRLARHGVALSAAAAGLALGAGAAAGNVPPALVTATMQTAAAVAAGAAGAAPAGVLALTEGVLKSMSLSKLKTAAAVALTLALVGLGAGVYHSLSAAQGKGTQPDEKKAKVTVLAPSDKSGKIAHGRTAPGEGWEPYGPTEEEAAKGVYIDVDTSEAKFKSVPTYITSLGGDNCHWEVTGATAIYPRLDKEGKPLPLETGFRIYLRYPPDPSNIHPGGPAKYKWYVNWVAYGE
jgi:RNA polymerase sigma factor (sigma-70 family)